MKLSNRLAWACGLLATLGFQIEASADAIAPLYSVTDLGANYSLQQDASGAVSSVTNGDGSQTYAFDKSPVTSIDIRQDGGAHFYSFTQWTLQDGAHQVGYNFDYGGGLAGTPLGAGINFPTFEPTGNGWFVLSGSPVADLNAQGQVVGTSLLYSSMNNRAAGLQMYAAFSDPQGASHGFGAATVDNLNNYLAGALGVYLTSAVKIDDMGRIIAEGTLNGQDQDFLLTPVGLSSAPIPAPEPAALVTLAIGLATLASRRLRGSRATAA